MLRKDQPPNSVQSRTTDCNWRTAPEASVEINRLMGRKVELEHGLDMLHDRGEKDKAKSQPMFNEIATIDKQLGKLIRAYSAHFNPHWGEVMRAGVEPSRFAGQVEKYACIYMGRIADFAEYSPRTYYRPKKRPLPHELD